MFVESTIIRKGGTHAKGVSGQDYHFCQLSTDDPRHVAWVEHDSDLANFIAASEGYRLARDFILPGMVGGERGSAPEQLPEPPNQIFVPTEEPAAEPNQVFGTAMEDPELFAQFQQWMADKAKNDPNCDPKSLMQQAAEMELDGEDKNLTSPEQVAPQEPPTPDPTPEPDSTPEPETTEEKTTIPDTGTEIPDTGTEIPDTEPPEPPSDSLSDWISKATKAELAKALDELGYSIEKHWKIAEIRQFAVTVLVGESK